MSRKSTASALAIGALALGLAIAPRAAGAADYRTIDKQQYGAWSVEAARDSEDGTHACSVANQSLSGDMLFMISVMERPAQLFLSLSDRRWNMQRGAQGRIRITIDGRAWNASVRSVTSTQLVAVLSTQSGSTETFLRAFMRGSRLQIDLPSGQRLNAGLSGTTRAINAMIDCRDRFFASARASGKPGVAAPRPAPRPAPSNPLGSGGGVKQ